MSFQALATPGQASAAPASAVPLTLGGRAVRLEAAASMEAVRTLWTSFEAEALTTPCQSFAFLSAWASTVGVARGLTPFPVVVREASGAVAALLPLGLGREHGLIVAQFLGAKDANYHMGLWRRDLAPEVTATEAEALIAALPQVAPKGRLDLIALTHQPVTWDGIANPLAKLTGVERSASSGWCGALEADFETLIKARTSSTSRGKLRRKEARLAELGPVRFHRAKTAPEADAIIDVFMRQKAERFAQQGLSDAFAGPEYRAFFKAAATEGLEAGRPGLDLVALYVGDEIVATFGGNTAGGRFCGMINSMVLDERMKWSPGEILLNKLVADACARGLTTFDLGVGEMGYKATFCPDEQPLVDLMVGLSPLGRTMAALIRAKLALKRHIKRSPRLWALVKRFRQGRAAVTAAAPVAAAAAVAAGANVASDG